jgi:glycerol-3-phosphate cytidylyltransferase-like family protein
VIHYCTSFPASRLVNTPVVALYRNALSFGNRLFVGVCGDADCSAYKRPPIMNHAERCAEVFGCKAVTKIIPNAPCFGELAIYAPCARP